MRKKSTLSGRTVIYTDNDIINSSNVVEIVQSALIQHQKNYLDICYLYNYFKGIQPVLEREKEIRPEILNRIVENRANEIVSFKVGYTMGEPIQYINRSGKEGDIEAINILNDFVFSEDKHTKDKELAEWLFITGTSYRIVLPRAKNDLSESPARIYTLDPRFTTVVYHSGLGNTPKLGIKNIIKQNGEVVTSVYSEKDYFEIMNNKIITSQPHALGMVPIIEYPADSARLGAFEIVLPLLDALNEVASNRLDGVEQFIQALLVLKGVDLESEELVKLKELGGLKLPIDGDAKYLVQELNQMHTQVLVDYLYQAILTICGMPNRNGGSSTSDTGSAVIMRDGWYAAESRAKAIETTFKKSEKEFLRLFLKIANVQRNLNLKLSSVDIRFTRRNYENIQEKTQVLTTMLGNDNIHPSLAFAHCGMFADPDTAYTMSMEYSKNKKIELEKDILEFSEKQVAAVKTKGFVADGRIQHEVKK